MSIHVILDKELKDLDDGYITNIRVEEIKGYRKHDHTFSWVSLYCGRSYWMMLDHALEAITGIANTRVIMFESKEATERHIKLHELEYAHPVKLTELLERVEV